MSDGFIFMLRQLYALIGSMLAAHDDESAPEVAKPIAPPAKQKSVKLGIVVGHTSKAKGAVSPWIGREFDFNAEQAKLIEAAADGTPVEVMTMYQDPDAGYTDRLSKAYARLDAWGADCTIELHFNSFDNPQANGTETLHSLSEGSKTLAAMVQRTMLDNFGLTSRGLITRRRHGGRGWYSMYAGKAPAILIEPGFGSNEVDAQSLAKNWPAFAKELVHDVQEWKKLR